MAAGIAPRPPAACRRGGEAPPSPRPREDTLRKKARGKKKKVRKHYWHLVRAHGADGIIDGQHPTPQRRYLSSPKNRCSLCHFLFQTAQDKARRRTAALPWASLARPKSGHTPSGAERQAARDWWGVGCFGGGSAWEVTARVPHQRRVGDGQRDKTRGKCSCGCKEQERATSAALALSQQGRGCAGAATSEEWDELGGLLAPPSSRPSRAVGCTGTAGPHAAAKRSGGKKKQNTHGKSRRRPLAPVPRIVFLVLDWHCDKHRLQHSPMQAGCLGE